MTEIIIGCSYTYGSALEMDCEEEPLWRLSFHCDDPACPDCSGDDQEARQLISCDHHLADLARGLKELYGADVVTLEELTK